MEKQQEGLVHVGAFVERDVHAAVHEVAKAQDRSVSSIVRRALRKEIERAHLNERKA